MDLNSLNEIGKITRLSQFHFLVPPLKGPLPIKNLRVAINVRGLLARNWLKSETTSVKENWWDSRMKKISI